MLYHSSGSAASSRRVRHKLTLTPDVSRPDDRDVNRFAVHRLICRTVLDAVLDEGSPDEEIDCVVDIRLVADVPRADAIVEGVVRVDISFDPTAFGADPTRSIEMSPEDGLRRVVENEVDRVWDLFCLSKFVDDVRIVASCLHILTCWNGSSAIELLGALQKLEPVVLRHGHDLDDVVDLRKLRTPVADVRPESSREHGMLLVDRAGYVLRVDPRGRLQATRPSLKEFEVWQRAEQERTAPARQPVHA